MGGLASWGYSDGDFTFMAALATFVNTYLLSLFLFYDPLVCVLMCTDNDICVVRPPLRYHPSPLLP